MAVGSGSQFPLHPIAGVRIGVHAAGIRKPGRRDLVIFELAANSQVAASFTRNAFCAAPVLLAREHLGSAEQTIRYLLINTGNANAGTGAPGLEDARACCARLAQLAGVEAQSVLPFSTGVIGEPLPVERIVAGIPAALQALAADAWEQAAEGIMTTDTRPKGASRQFEVDGRRLRVSGIAKGAGMIRPDMATMLAFLATDAPVCPRLLQELLDAAIARSFNSITVDGDTSTNDACVLVATGAAGGKRIERGDASCRLALAAALDEVCIELAQGIIRDAEGATKFVTVRVSGGRDNEECRKAAYVVAESPLVKTALFASDPNWGRILAAVGRAGLAALDVSLVAITINGVRIASAGARDPGYTEAAGQRAMTQEEILIEIELGRGDAAATIWSTDLSHDYVRINAEYRS